MSSTSTPFRSFGLFSAALTLSLASWSSAATYHVAKTGSDSNAGTAAAPFLTIGKAMQAATIAPGDVVIVHAGTYNETITPGESGTATGRITIKGERGTNGEFLTIVEPTAAAPSWTQDLAFDPTGRVYKSTLSNPAVLIYGDKSIARMGSNRMGDVAADDYGGLDRLVWDRDKIVTGEKSGFGSTVSIVPAACPIKFWDFTYAVYGYSGGYTWIRCRDGENPNSMNLRYASSGTYGVNLTNLNYITVRDFAIRGASTAVQMTHTAGNTCSNNVVENNELKNGVWRVYMAGTGCSNNAIRGNRMTLNFHGTTLTGANDKGWAGNAPYDLGLKSYFYLFFKYSVSNSGSTEDTNVELANVGEGNEISDNEIFNGGEGIQVSGTSDTGAATKLHHNVISGFSSIGITMGVFQNAIPKIARCKVEIHDNQFLDNQLGIRFHDLDLPQDADSPRYIYVYRNRFWNPRGLGTGMFFNFNDSNSQSNSDNVNLYIYHNSFGGCYEVAQFNGYADENGGLPKTYFLNNVFSNGTMISAALIFKGRPVPPTPDNDATPWMGAWDYNWNNVPGEYTSANPAGADWFGTHNQVPTASAKVWSESEPNWLLPASGVGATARATGVDLSQSSITVTEGASNVNITGPLPGMTTGYFTGSAPDMGATQASSVLQPMAHRLKLTFNTGDVDEYLSDFPVLVKLNSSRINYSHIRSDFADIRFTDSDGITLLKYEVEKWNTAGDSYIWVKVPRLSRLSATRPIFMYYGNSSLTTDGQDKNNVWNSSYKGVWHLKETGINSTNYRLDSTVNANNASPVSFGDGAELATGKIGDGQRLESAGAERLSVADAASLNLGGAMTVEGWIKPVTTATAPLFAKYTSSTSGFRLHYIGDKVQLQLAPSAGTMVETPSTVGTSDWTHVAGTVDGTKMALYVNGALVTEGTASSAITNSATVMTLAGLGGNNFDGYIDEFRVSNIARSGGWVKAQYASMQDSLLTYTSADAPVYSYRVKISFVLSDTSQELANVPVLVKLNSTRINYAHTSAGGSDLRFVASDGVTPLTFRIDSWNASGTSYVWVKVPKIEAHGRAHVYMYYGSATTGLPGQSAASAIWDSNYKAVWHLDEGGTGTRSDSTSNGNVATPQNYDGPESTAAQISVGDNLEGGASNERMTVPASQSSLQLNNDLTVEGWFKADSTIAASGVLISKYVNDTSGYRLVWNQATGKVEWEIHGSASRNTLVGPSVTSNTWYYIVASIDSTEKAHLWVSDGTTMSRTTGTSSLPLTNSTADTYLGGAASYNFKGIVDEFRVSNVARTEAWIQTQYRSTNDTLNHFGAEEVP